MQLILLILIKMKHSLMLLFLPQQRTLADSALNLADQATTLMVAVLLSTKTGLVGSNHLHPAAKKNHSEDLNMPKIQDSAVKETSHRRLKENVDSVLAVEATTTL